MMTKMDIFLHIPMLNHGRSWNSFISNNGKGEICLLRDAQVNNENTNVVIILCLYFWISTVSKIVIFFLYF